MSKASIVDYAITLFGIFALTAGATVLATEDPNGIAEEDRDRKRIPEKLTPDDDTPAVSTQGRTLKLMSIIWTLKTTSGETK